jgi:hypothetical protein
MTTDRATHDFQQVYDFDYYAGSQVGIFIGDTFIDDISSVGWNLVQNKEPIYGYASYHYDRVAPGQVLVNGSFTLNFKERGYLFVILERYNKLLNAANNSDGRQSRTGDLAEIGVRKNIERLVAQSEAHPNFAFDTNDLRFLASLHELSDDEFNTVSSMFEEAAWGEQAVDIVDRKDGRNVKPGKSIPSDSRGSILVRPDQFPAFDIVVGYGDVFRENPSGRKRRSMNSTTKRIYNVDLIRESQVIEINGAPIQEQYDFIARTIL